MPRESYWIMESIVLIYCCGLLLVVNPLGDAPASWSSSWWGSVLLGGYEGVIATAVRGILGDADRVTALTSWKPAGVAALESFGAATAALAGWRAIKAAALAVSGVRNLVTEADSI